MPGSSAIPCWPRAFSRLPTFLKRRFHPDNLISNLESINGTSANGCCEYTMPGPRAFTVPTQRRTRNILQAKSSPQLAPGGEDDGMWC